jgi:hypothetical protein
LDESLHARLMAVITLLTGALSNAFAQSSGPGPVKIDRTVLPIQQPRPTLYTELDARKVKASPRF